MDAHRAMREARYAERNSRAAQPSDAPRSRPVPVAPPADPSAAGPSAAADEMCGHRAISGRTCTREQGHAAKSHRYS